MAFRAVTRTAVRVCGVRRPLSTTAVRRHGESQSTDPEFEIEKLKDASVQQQKQGRGEWMSSLASDSEEAVKADKLAADPKAAVAHAKEVFEKKAAADKTKTK